MFDLDLLLKHKLASYKEARNSKFYEYVHLELISRIKLVNKAFKAILVITYNYEKNFKSELKILYPDAKIKIINLNDLKTATGSYDLVILSYVFHWLENPLTILTQLRDLIGGDGIIMGNLAGAGSFMNVRKSLINLEIKNNSKHIAHIIPLISFEQIVALLKQADFDENIVDIDEISLTKENMLLFLKFFKQIGENNVLINSLGYNINKKIYYDIVDFKAVFEDKVNLINFISSPRKNVISFKSEDNIN